METKLNTLQVTDTQLWVIMRALDFYSRVGIGQWSEIKDHPSFERHLEEVCRPKKEPEIGDRTPQGEILDIKKGKALISGSVRDGFWNEEHEWKKLEDVKLSTDYTKYHEIRDVVDARLADIRNILIQDYTAGRSGSWGIHNPSADDSVRIAFDIYQVIRHEKWKLREDKSFMTVDSSIHFTHRKDRESNLITCKLGGDEKSI
jgi:hypothetical protein